MRGLILKGKVTAIWSTWYGEKKGEALSGTSAPSLGSWVPGRYVEYAYPSLSYFCFYGYDLCVCTYDPVVQQYVDDSYMITLQISLHLCITQSLR